jgi:hypothetical protein
VSAENLLLIGPALFAAFLVIVGLRKQLPSLFHLAFSGILAAALAALLSFFSGFTLAWTIAPADTAIVLSALASGLVAAGLVVGTARLVRAR